MFLTKMVKNVLETVKKSDYEQANQKSQQSPARTGATKYKTNKKSNKSEKIPIKASLKSEENKELQQIYIKKETNFKKSSKTTNKPLAPTKVKSASWKRSEKSINPFNTFSNKKHKTLRKKSPNWLKFPNSKIKITDSKQLVKDIEPTSACRPGTLYSDVLFGARNSNLVKIKNLTPRNINNATNSSSMAQKKLCKALFKFGDQLTKETSDESEIEDKKELFPVLQKVENKMSSSCLKNEEVISSDHIKPLNSKLTASIHELTIDIEPSTTSNTKNNEECKPAKLSDLQNYNSLNNDESLENCFEHSFQNLNTNLSKECATYSKDQTFLFTSISEIPKWNFTDADTRSEAFPKFLGQFDDENYLRAEKMAWLGLKLALGNNSIEYKSKF